MKISIVGGGPAGLYFACAVKRLKPNTNITVFEALNESENAYGLGYTLQRVNTALLHRLDKHYFQGLFPNGPTPLITKATFKTNSDTKYFDFSQGYSVTRFELMRYLRQLAERSGVAIKETKVTPAQIKKLQRSSDLLVGADGLNSQVRNTLPQGFVPKIVDSDLRFSWFYNETASDDSTAGFYAFKAPEGSLFLTSYPVTPRRHVVIIEMSRQCLATGRFKGSSPSGAVEYLKDLFSQNADIAGLESAGLPWYTFKTNSNRNLHSRNIALIGDAAYHFHYSAGQGVTNAFSMAYTLAQCLARQDDLRVALEHYTRSVKLTLKQHHQKSMEHVRWLEKADEYFDRTDESHWIEMLRLKNEFEISRFMKTAV